MPSAEYQRERRKRIKANLPYNRKQRARQTKEQRQQAQKLAVKKWNAAHPDKYKEYYTKNNNRPEVKVAKRWRKIFEKFNLRPAEWNEMFKMQGFRCGACLRSDPGAKSGWCTDHDHKTGKVRGILCHPCNVVLGRVKDNSTVLYELAAYLENHNVHPCCE